MALQSHLCVPKANYNYKTLFSLHSLYPVLRDPCTPTQSPLGTTKGSGGFPCGQASSLETSLLFYRAAKDQWQVASQQRPDLCSDTLLVTGTYKSDGQKKFFNANFGQATCTLTGVAFNCREMICSRLHTVGLFYSCSPLLTPYFCFVGMCFKCKSSI